MLTMQGAKRHFAGRIPKRRLGTTGLTRTPLPCSCGGGSFRSGVQPPTGSDRLRNLGESLCIDACICICKCIRALSKFERPAQMFGGGGSFRSGVQPPTGSDRLRNLGESLCIDACICICKRIPAPFSNLKDPRKCLAGVDRSGRGFNPRPAQDRHRPAQDRLRGGGGG